MALSHHPGNRTVGFPFQNSEGRCHSAAGGAIKLFSCLLRDMEIEEARLAKKVYWREPRHFETEKDRYGAHCSSCRYIGKELRRG